MKSIKKLHCAMIGAVLTSVGRLAVPCHAAITGNPSTDSWTFEGISSTAANYNNGAGNYNVNIFSTAFQLEGSSPLIGNLDGFNWNANDLIVGVGGVFNGANSDLTYNGPGGATSTRIVIKYGTISATWSPESTSPSSPGYGSLANGGVGSILLGTSPYDFYPANSGTLVVPADSPLEQTSPSATTAISGNVGRVITEWSGDALVGFESFMDLTLLNAQYPSNGVALENEFVLDLQRGTGEYQDSQGQLPGVVPEPNSLVLILAGAVGLSLMQRKCNRKWSEFPPVQHPHFLGTSE